MTVVQRLAALATTAALAVGAAMLPAATSSEGACTMRTSAAAGVPDDHTIDLDTRPPHRAYFALQREGDTSPPPEVGHWNSFLPKSRELPNDPYRTIVANADPEDDESDPPPTFEGPVIGEIRTIGVRIARGHAVNPIPSQLSLAMRIDVDGIRVVDGVFPVMADEGRMDPCHLIEYGMYYVLLKDVDLAIAAQGIENAPGVEHTVRFTFAPSGEGENVPDFEVFALDTTLAPTSLEFNGGTTPGPRVSVAP